MKNNLQFSKSEKGQSLVELSVSILVLFILLAGVVDLGRAIFQYLSMRDAAQEGAAYGSMYPGSCNQIVDRVKSTVIDGDNVNVTVTIDGVACGSATASNACSGKEVKVVLSQPNFAITMPFLGSFIGGQSINMEATATDTILRPFCP